MFSLWNVGIILWFFSPSPFESFNQGLTIAEWMSCTIKAQVMGQHSVIERQNVKLRYFSLTVFSPVAWIISLLTRKDVSADCPKHTVALLREIKNNLGVIKDFCSSKRKLVMVLWGNWHAGRESAGPLRSLHKWALRTLAASRARFLLLKHVVVACLVSLAFKRGPCYFQDYEVLELWHLKYLPSCYESVQPSD